MIEPKTRRRERLHYDDAQQTQLKDMQARLARVERRLDRLEQRLDRLDEKIASGQRDLSAKLDRLADKFDSGRNHGQILTATVVGIALAVVYSILK